ncbi:hypothetical protein CXB51_034846 [Gossypium anomalum]|uniref:Uncharacterized protein n=1 Tax=Gossypium anomalum TaxID=47600 RepID=A0A8J5XY41_9ROSI|nr:hypothetical protein CXB51_034846 [Gossypium anomalum]
MFVFFLYYFELGGNTFHWAAKDDGVRRQSSGSSARQPKDKGKITGRKGELWTSKKTVNGKTQQWRWRNKSSG